MADSGLVFPHQKLEYEMKNSCSFEYSSSPGSFAFGDAASRFFQAANAAVTPPASAIFSYKADQLQLGS
jgi:hypothetical protein